MTAPTPETIRQALEVLEYFGLYDSAMAAALSLAIDKLDAPPVFVSADTPAGTEISPDRRNTFWFMAPRLGSSDSFWFQDEDGNAFRGDYSEGWLEIRRPEPPDDLQAPAPATADWRAIQRGQWRAMPLQIRWESVDGTRVGVQIPEIGEVVFPRATVEQWPVLSVKIR